jgi:hypothetical protein
MSLDISGPTILKIDNFYNQQYTFPTKFRPAWTIYIHHRDYHESGRLYDALQQTASHSSGF